MTLIEQLKNEFEQENVRANQEKTRLQRENMNYVRTLWEKNKRICELEKTLTEKC